MFDQSLGLPHKSGRRTLAIQHLVDAWDRDLISVSGDTGLGNAIIVAIVNATMNNYPLDLENLLIELNVDEIHRTMFMLHHKFTVDQIMIDLQNFIAVNTVMSWNIVNNVLVMEVI